MKTKNVACPECEGSGETHFCVDKWNWKQDCHDTDEWTEECQDCRGAGFRVFDAEEDTEDGE